MRILEALRHDADDLVILAVEQQRAMENVSGRAEHRLPERVADDGDFFVPQLVVAATYLPAKLRSGLKGAKEIAIDARRADAFRRALRSQTEDGLSEDGHVLKGMTVTLEVVEIGVGGAEDFDWQVELPIGRVEIDEPARISVRQGADEHRIHQAEDRRACADAEGKREYRGYGESWALAQGAQAIAQVLHGLFDPQQRALVAMCLFCLLHATVSASRCEPCFFRRHAAAFEVVDEEGEVRCDFACKVLFGALVGEEIAELGDDSSQVHDGYCSFASSFSTVRFLHRAP